MFLNNYRESVFICKLMYQTIPIDNVIIDKSYPIKFAYSITQM